MYISNLHADIFIIILGALFSGSSELFQHMQSLKIVTFYLQVFLDLFVLVYFILSANLNLLKHLKSSKYSLT